MESNVVNFVCTHLGPKPFPDYGYCAIEQIRLFNGVEPVYLVIDRESPRDAGRLERSGCSIVDREDLKKTSKHLFYLRTNLLRRRGLGGFWLYATERFFVIEELMLSLGLEDVVHIENDVMVYRSFRELLPALRSGYPEIAVTRDNDDRCIAGLVYLRDAAALARFTSFVSRKILLRRKTDMSLLALYASKLGNAFLPVVPPSYVELHGLVNRKGERPVSGGQYCLNYAELGGLFDAASFGQYIGGIDKIHGQGDTRGFVNETACYDPSRFSIEWIESSEGLTVPEAVLDGKRSRIFNLHIHSKELGKYRSDSAVAQTMATGSAPTTERGKA